MEPGNILKTFVFLSIRQILSQKETLEKKRLKNELFLDRFDFFLALRKHMIRINNSGKHLIFLLNAKF